MEKLLELEGGKLLEFRGYEERAELQVPQYTPLGSAGSTHLPEHKSFYALEHPHNNLLRAK